MKKYFYIILFVLPLCGAAQKKVRALFVGNSYTYSNNLPQLLADMALANGDTLEYDASTFGGYTFQMHSTNSTTLSKIAQGTWDYVILQGQSQEPAFDPAYVTNNVYPYAHKLDSLVHAADSCVETVFFMTWGRKNGDASNCASYPPVCTYAGMQGRLRERYLYMGSSNNASVAPVGCVWREVRNLNPSFDLYVSDESHPSIYGSYLAACVFYETLFQKKTAGINFYSTLTSADAQLIQNAADNFFSDSLTVFAADGNIPFSKFNYVFSGSDAANFSFTGDNAANYSWDFGDGGASSIQNPQHVYSAAGTYVVTLTVSNDCFSDDYSDTLVIQPAGIKSKLNEKYLAVTVLTDGNIFVRINNEEILEIVITDLNGRELVRKKNTFSDAIIPFSYAGGIYFISASTARGVYTSRFLFGGTR